MTKKVIALLLIAAPACAIDLNAIKQQNQPDYSNCIDLDAQTWAEKRTSSGYTASLKAYLKSAFTEADHERGITGFISGTGSDAQKTVFIFEKGSPLAVRPGQAFRSEYRTRLEALVARWRSQQAETSRQFLIRFDDECDVPVVDWK